MDREKQVEEMFHIFLNYRFSMPAEDFSYKGMVENFIDNNYRKINEGEVVIRKEEKQKLLKEMYEQGRFDALADLEKDGKVVISKEEYERLKQEQTISYTAMINGSYLDRIEDLENRLLNIRKETAREILLKIKEVKTQDCGYTDWLDDTFFGVEFMKLAKQFGVDLGEEK